jgi:signal transduction histidine kinase
MAAYQAALAIASELHPDSVLQSITDSARQVVPAKYAALGVADDNGRVHTFITSGLTHRERLAIGEIPRGHGLIGALIKDGTPLLVEDIASDPRSVGFPPNHPPMNKLLGVPIKLGSQVLGDLYLTEPTESEHFTDEDLAALTILAVHAAQAIDRARLFAAAWESQREAEQQRDHLEVILNSMSSAVLIQSSPDGYVDTVNNAARALLLDSRKLDLRPAKAGRDYQILHANGSPLPREQWPGGRAWRGEMVRNMPCTFVTANGRSLPVLAQAAPLRDSEGVITRVVIVFQDITRIREAEQLKDDFLSLVSHELRTPLTAIHGGAYLLANQGESIDSETRQDILEDLVRESERLDRTLSNMLTLTAIEAGQTDPETEPILVRKLVKRTEQVVAAHLPGYTFTHDFPPEIALAEGNPELLGHVLTNLYENAAKYSAAGTEIHTAIRAEGGAVKISITDQGVGIAPENLSRVFERFRRPGADPAIRGMGLGLYLSRHLIRAQGGTIAASSPGVGKGSTFTIILPIAAE